MDHDPVLDAVGQRLRSLRQQRQLSLAGLSAMTGISTSTLSRLESGGRKPDAAAGRTAGVQDHRPARRGR